MFSSHAISREPLSMRERMSKILDQLQDRDMVEFNHLFSFEEGRRGVVVTFTAILELMKAHLIDIAQAEPFAPIYIKPAAQASEA
jgi:segregation and condensation protein A